MITFTPTFPTKRAMKDALRAGAVVTVDGPAPKDGVIVIDNLDPRWWGKARVTAGRIWMVL